MDRRLKAIEKLLKVMKQESASTLWSNAVTLSRRSIGVAPDWGDDGVSISLMDPNRNCAFLVQLYPDDQDWSCECAAAIDPCHHAIAAAIVTRNKLQSNDEVPSKSSTPKFLFYLFTSYDDKLLFGRGIGNETGYEPLAGASIFEAQRRGKCVLRSIDFEVDGLLAGARAGELPSAILAKVLRKLQDHDSVVLDHHPVRINQSPRGYCIRVVSINHGYEVTCELEEQVQAIWQQQSVTKIADTLHPLAEIPFELKLGVSRRFQHDQLPKLISEYLPRWQRSLPVTGEVSELEKSLVSVNPKIDLQWQADNSHYSVRGIVVYGDPPIAKIIDGQLELTGQKIPARKREEEDHLGFNWKQITGKSLGNWSRLSSREFEKLISSLSKNNADLTNHIRELCRSDSTLSPRISVSENLDFNASFVTNEPKGKQIEVAAEQVLLSWEQGASGVMLPELGWVKFPKEWLQESAASLRALLQAKDESGKVPKASLSVFSKFLSQQSVTLEPKVKEFILGSVEISQDEPFVPRYPVKFQLRPYQSEGVSWLARRKGYDLGVLLADDMGLGKTLQVITVFKTNVLVIVPTSLISNWRDELNRFRSDLSVHLYHGKNRELPSEVADVVITTYGTLRLDLEVLQARYWDTIVIDEAQVVKNPQSQITNAIYQLQAKWRVALSGTPVENKLTDLWSIFNFLNPGLLGSLSQFNERFAPHASESLLLLRTLVQPFILRRRKTEVARDLPPRTEVVLRAELTKKEKSIYQGLLMASRDDIVEKLALGNTIEALELILRLRQACCHPALLPGHADEREDSAKVSLLLDRLAVALEEGHQVLIFSQWTSFLDLIAKSLEINQLSYLRLDGATKDRAGVVEKFQTGSAPIMLLSLKAGGVGLNLTAADHVFIMDPWWNPAAESQAADRAHRIGQSRPVIVHKLIAADTIEERVLALQQTKAQLAASITDEPFTEWKLSAADLANLF